MHLCFIFDGKCLKVLTYQVDVSTMVPTIAINLAENNIRVNASFEFCLFLCLFFKNNMQINVILIKELKLGHCL